ncbi:MAG: single-stranded-DNA-specific exonuclease RecJ [Bacteroidales bacterium]|jgi:single-stranded-DNA-specific exonuclease|nr:single-stranded-DNA-specific exonuclease RecJ [Bacteroidales bacterium]
MKHYTWRIKPCQNSRILIQDLAEKLNISPIIAQLLVLRDVRTVENARKFLNVKQSLSEIYNPFLMKNMRKAVDRICEAIEKKQTILVYGDYDVDGTTAVSIVYSFLHRLGADLHFYIPDREKEGYGVSQQGIEWAIAHNIDLILTLDCGIKAVGTIAQANQNGIDVIVCDHHEVADELPAALAILNPKQKDCLYPFKDLSGCGVGFKLIHALCIEKKLPLKEYLFCYLDILALSIAADMVSVVDENRIFMFNGLWKMKEKPSIAVRSILESAGIYKSNITVSDVVFKITPRINAAGRIHHAKTVVELLLCSNEREAYEICKDIEAYNKERKEIDMEITRNALQNIEVTDPAHEKYSYVVYAPEWHKGVIGIVASRIVEHHYKPTIVFCGTGDIICASARSVAGFDLYHAIEQCSHLLTNFGGHKYAAGLSLKKENLEEFVQLFETVVNQTITPKQLQPSILIDAELMPHDISMDFYEHVQRLAPFGPRNMRPVFVMRGVRVAEKTKIIGADKKHVKFYFTDLSDDIEGIAFNMAHKWEQLQKDSLAQGIDLCFSIAVNTFNGKTTLQLDIKDISLPQTFEQHFVFKTTSRSLRASCLRKQESPIDRGVFNKKKNHILQRKKNCYDKKNINHRRSRIHRLACSSSICY